MLFLFFAPRVGTFQTSISFELPQNNKYCVCFCKWRPTQFWSPVRYPGPWGTREPKASTTSHVLNALPAALPAASQSQAHHEKHYYPRFVDTTIQEAEASPKVPQLIRIWIQIFLAPTCLYIFLSILINKSWKYLLETSDDKSWALASFCVSGSALSVGLFLPGAMGHMSPSTWVYSVSQPAWFYLPQISLSQI